LAKVTGKLAKKGINIKSAYATMPKGAKKAVLLVVTSQKSTG
jgi:predicted regulator of amino acid metabolism with ACT domain